MIVISGSSRNTDHSNAHVRMQDPNRQTRDWIIEIYLERRLDAVVVDRQPNRRSYRLAKLARRVDWTQRAHLLLSQRADRINKRRLAHARRGLSRQQRVLALVARLKCAWQHEDKDQIDMVLTRSPEQRKKERNIPMDSGSAPTLPPSTFESCRPDHG